ncbi:putative deoxyribonuclease TATDN3 isoform X1 [Apostichopus japonicus]|uniref:Putative deoxyribonuclease TATDN3 isoform X1 n=1 Tax=Stichopus japonicus TaxID=307972 RepID=A0A2G8L2B5_STIJA|nr:putative deoxyribonuclease TATDN3 isoform X1 [Apostichopus japonicus]
MLGKMSGFIDCHCHLASTDFKEDIHEVITRAKKTGVRCALVVPDLKYELPLVCDLAKTYPDFIAPALESTLSSYHDSGISQGCCLVDLSDQSQLGFPQANNKIHWH